MITDDDLISEPIYSSECGHTSGRSIDLRRNERLIDKLTQNDALGNTVAIHVKHLILRFLFDCLPSVRLLLDMLDHRLVPTEENSSSLSRSSPRTLSMYNPPC